MALLKVGIGISPKDLTAAVRDVAQEVRAEVKKPKLLMFFCTYNYPPSQYKDALAYLKKAFPDSPLVGGSVAGVYTKEKVYHAFASREKERGAALLGIDSEYLNIGVGVGRGADKNPQKAGEDSISLALDDLEYNPLMAFLAMMRRGIREMLRVRPISGLMITSGCNNNHNALESEILKGVWNVGKGFIRLGGGGTASSFVPGRISKGKFPELQTYQFLNDKVLTEAVISVVFGSDLEVGYGVATGFEPVGPGIFVTEAKEWLIKKANNRPAREIMAEILEAHTAVTKEKFIKETNYSLEEAGISWGHPEVLENYYWPNIPLDLFGSSVLMSHNVKKGDALSLLRATEAGFIKADGEAIEMMADDAKTSDFGLVFMFSSPNRNVYLKEESVKEIERIEGRLGEKTKIFGIGTYGTIGSLSGRPSMASGQTLSLVGISNTLVAEKI